MGLIRHVRTPRMVALVGALGALALLLGWSFGTNMKAEAHIPHPGLNYSIEAVGEDGCDTTEGDAICYIDPGTEFTLNVTLDALPDDIPSYEGFDVYLQYTGLTSGDDADAQAYWPDCGFPVAHFEAGLVAAGCSIGIEPGTPSVYDGIMLTNSFTCSESGTISLAQGDNKTDLLGTISEHHAESEGTLETLDITCGSPPTPTPTSTAVPATDRPIPTALPATGTAGVDQDGGTGAGIWLAIAALMTLAAAGIGAFGWRFAGSAR